MEGPVLVLVAVAILAFGVISRRAESTPLTPPIFFVALGMLVAGLGIRHIEVSDGAIHLLAEITLAVVLFTDASRIHIKPLRQGHNLPNRMRVIALSLTIEIGALV